MADSTRLRKFAGCVAGAVLCASGAYAGPWAEIGDAQLRSDIAVLASAGVIDNITMSWPLPWAGILYRLQQDDTLDRQPDYVAEAAERVRARATAETSTGRLHTSESIDATNAPAVIRGFDALGRQTAQGQVAIDYLWDSTAMHLALGAKTNGHGDRQTFVADGSFIAQRIGNTIAYAGYVSHWWGPGWISALSLSNNARPIPQIGISRIDTRPFESSWLRWLGPWQVEMFVGVLNGPRLARNTIYDGFRFAFSPLSHLEIGLSRTDEMCGGGHPCKPLTNYFNLANQPNAQNAVNDEGTIDVRYSGAFAHWTYEVYAQAMNEDTNPIVHSGTSHLFGASVWTHAWGSDERITLEYSDSLATKDIWGGDILHGFSYNNFQYLDGMRYRGRTLGFSLDSDSRLLSVQAVVTDAARRSYSLTFHRANISDLLNNGGNAVTSAPVAINLVEARVDLPLKLDAIAVRLQLAGRLQDDQPRPDKGFLATFEVSLGVAL